MKEQTKSRWRLRDSGYLKFFGPAMLISVAYVDPGNFGTDIAAGAQFRYELVWAVWLASIMAMLLQYLSGKLGIATGRSLPELIRVSLGSRRRAIAYWLACEAFAISTDLAEFLGVTIALNLLLGIPLIWSAVIASFDILAIFALAGNRFRRIEMAIAGFVSFIGLGYVYEVLTVRPDFLSITAHTFVPTLNASSAPFVVGIVGATVMPHALALHSWLTKNKLVKGDDEEKRHLMKLHLVDNVLNLSAAALVNVAILVMSAAAFAATGSQVSSIGEAYTTLAPLFGALAAVVFALTLLASGLSSSTVGVLAGQAMMEGLLGSKVHPWVRRIVIRGVNVFPTMVALSIGLNPLSLLVYSQVALSLLIPLPLIPIIYYTSRRSFMGEFVNKRVTTLLAMVFAGVILCLNAYLLIGASGI
jgi:manganese transport protein